VEIKPIMTHKRGLTQKNKMFADAYAGDSNEAADIAGIGRDHGRRLVQSVTSASITPSAIAVQERIKTREDTEVRPGVANRQRRQRFWTESMDDGALSMADRLRASELLGKSEADFVDVIKGADSMLLVLGSPRKQIESKVLENHDEHDTGREASSVPSEEK